MIDSFLETLYDVLFHPGTAMRNIAAGKMVCGAAVVFLASIFIPAWTVYLALKAAGMGKMAGIAIVAHSGGCLTVWILGAALFNLIAEFVGGKGNALGLFAAMGFAHLPRIFIVPIFVLTALATDGFAKVLILVFGITIAFWVLALDVEAIKGAHSLSTARAVLVILIPIVIVILAALAAILMLGISMFH